MTNEEFIFHTTYPTFSVDIEEYYSDKNRET